jgi:hypothetical protein
MAEVGRQLREEPLHVCTGSVPRRQPVARKGVPQVMEARLIPRAVHPADTRAPPELRKGTSHGAVLQRRSVAIDEERRLGRVGSVAFRPSLGIVAQRATQIGTDRHQPRLVEFRVADREQRRREIDVRERQVQRFAES